MPGGQFSARRLIRFFPEHSQVTSTHGPPEWPASFIWLPPASGGAVCTGRGPVLASLGGRQVPAGLLLTPWPVWSRVLGGAGGALLGRRQEREGGGLPGGLGQGAGALHSACVGMERRPDAGGQGAWRGALGGAAHGQAVHSQGVGRGGADGHELQGEDRGVSAEPQASRGDAGGGRCGARRTSY